MPESHPRYRCKISETETDCLQTRVGPIPQFYNLAKHLPKEELKKIIMLFLPLSSGYISQVSHISIQSLTQANRKARNKSRIVWVMDFPKPNQPNNQSLKPNQPNNQSLKPNQPNNQSLKPNQPNNQSLKPNQPNNQSLKPNQPNNQSLKPNQPNNLLSLINQIINLFIKC